MARYFLDSSALVKRYVDESGSFWVKKLVEPEAANDIYVAAVTGVEVVSALARRAKLTQSGSTSLSNSIAQFQGDFSRQYLVLGVLPSIITAAMEMANRHALRGYDCIQLAVARNVHRKYLDIGARCILISADLDLNAAAILEGITVENPNDHP